MASITRMSLAEKLQFQNDLGAVHSLLNPLYENVKQFIELGAIVVAEEKGLAEFISHCELIDAVNSRISRG